LHKESVTQSEIQLKTGLIQARSKLSEKKKHKNPTTENNTDHRHRKTPSPAAARGAHTPPGTSLFKTDATGYTQTTENHQRRPQKSCRNPHAPEQEVSIEYMLLSPTGSRSHSSEQKRQPCEVKKIKAWKMRVGAGGQKV